MKEKREIKSEVVTVRVTPTVKKKLEKLAEKHNRKLADKVCIILTNYVK